MLVRNNLDSYTPAIRQSGGGRWAYIGLIFSLLYFIHTGINFDALSLSDLALQLGLYLSFIGLYLVAISLPSTSVSWVLVLILVMLLLGTSLTPGTSSLFGYVAFLSSYYFAKGRAGMFACLTLITPLCAAWLFDLYSMFYLAPALGISVGMVTYGRFSRTEYINKQIQRQHSQQIEQLATIAERERIARDMHDLLGHSLSSLALKAELAEKLLAKGRFNDAQKEVSELAHIARQSLSEVRYAVTDMQQKGLKAVATNLTQQLVSQGFNVESSIDELTLPARIESSVIMLVKEWITNILRHSPVGKVVLTIRQTRDTLTLDVLNPAPELRVKTKEGKTHRAHLTEGNGITGMRARVNQMQGRMSIMWQNDVSLSISIPLANNKGQAID
jgi:two-component system sensor histidine kinase DesK